MDIASKYSYLIRNKEVYEPMNFFLTLAAMVKVDMYKDRLKAVYFILPSDYNRNIHESRVWNGFDFFLKTSIPGASKLKLDPCDTLEPHNGTQTRDIQDGKVDYCSLVTTEKLPCLRYRLNILSDTGEVITYKPGYNLFMIIDTGIRQIIMDRNSHIRYPLHIRNEINHDYTSFQVCKHQEKIHITTRCYFGMSIEDLNKLDKFQVYFDQQPDNKQIELYPEWIIHRIKPNSQGLYYIPFPSVSFAYNIKFQFKSDCNRESVNLHRQNLSHINYDRTKPMITDLFNMYHDIHICPKETEETKEQKKDFVSYHCVRHDDHMLRIYVIPKNGKDIVDCSVVKSIELILSNVISYGTVDKIQHEIHGEQLQGLSYVFHPMNVNCMYPVNSLTIDLQSDFIGTLYTGKIPEMHLKITWNQEHMDGSLDIYYEAVNRFTFYSMY